MDRVITSVFDKDLTPVGGWWSHSKIKRELRGFEEAFPIYYDKDFYTDLADNDSPKFMNYLKKYNMTYSEDVKRSSSPDTIDYLNARIDALQKRVEFLEAQIEIKNK